MTKPTQPTLEQLYASASAAQTPAAPLNISAAILQAAHAQAASLATVEVATAMPPAKIWQHFVQTLSKLKVRLKSAFDLPSVRYGLPAMMVAVVGIKVAITDTTKKYAVTEIIVREEASVQVNTQVSPQVVPEPQTHATTTAKVATKAPTQTQAPTLTTPIAAQTTQAAPAVVTSHASITTEMPSTTKGEVAFTAAPSADALANNPKTLAQTSVDTNLKVAGYQNHSSTTQARATEPAMPSTMADGAANSPVLMSAPAPTPASVAMPAMGVGMPNQVALGKRSAVPSHMPAEQLQGLAKNSAIHPTEQLRLSIATTSINNGTLLIKCQPTPPLPAQVQALLAAGADPHHAWAGNRAASAVRLAQHCGFTETVAALLAFGKTP